MLFHRRNVRRARPAFAMDDNTRGLERLEPRELLSASFDPLSGTLIVVGSEGRDRIAVLDRGDGLVAVSGPVRGGGSAVFEGVQAIEVYGLGGADDILVETVFDVDGNAIDVYVDGGSGSDIIITGAGNDTVDAGEGNNKVSTGAGNDTISAGLGRDFINSGTGDDDIDAGDGSNQIIAGTGNDSVVAGSGKNVISTGTGDDEVTTGDGNDVILTDGGNDFIDAGGGKNSIDAGSGDDDILAGDGHDKILGGPGADDIDAGDGNNTIDGGSGIDDILAGAGNDKIFTGGDDGDVVDAGGGTNKINDSRRSSFRLSLRSPSFVVTIKPNFIAGFGSAGLFLGFNQVGALIDTFGSRTGGDVFGTFGQTASPIISPPLFSFTGIFRF